MLSPPPIPMAARITKYLNKYVRMGLCLIYLSIFYFWSQYMYVKISWRPKVDVCQAILETGSGRKLSHKTVYTPLDWSK
jgi:hypothetical protein